MYMYYVAVTYTYATGNEVVYSTDQIDHNHTCRLHKHALQLLHTGTVKSGY